MACKYQNSLIVSGDVCGLQDFVGRVHGDRLPLSFEKILPHPKLRGQQDWLPLHSKWMLRNWGSESDASFPYNSGTFLVRPWSIGLSFFTKKGAPEAAITEASDLFPDLHFDLLYSSNETSKAGRALFSKGALVESTVYQSGTDEWRNAMASQRTDLPNRFGPPSVTGIFTTPLAAVRELLGLRLKSPPENKRKETREDLVSKIKGNIFDAARTAETALMAGLETAGSLGFPLIEWRKSSFLTSTENAWKVRLGREGGGAATILWQPEISVQLLPPDEKAGPRAVLVRSQNLTPIPDTGFVVRNPSGLEIHTPSGWTICLRCSLSGKSTVCIAKDGEWQNGPDKTPAVREYSYSTEKGRVYESAEAHFSSGVIWNPAKSEPAYSEFSANGLLLRSADFTGGIQTGPLKSHVIDFPSLARGLSKQAKTYGRQKSLDPSFLF